MNPLVSICCTTYNHEEYIRDAIEGFLMQEVDFPIEIIIHDDASEDNTTTIIKEYAIMYPEVIKPIYQEKNQYSQGKKPWLDFVFPRANGKYIALCEGDDFWTDTQKLQKQVDFMEGNKQYVGCYTNFKIVDESSSDFQESSLAVNRKGDLTHLNILGLATPKTFSTLFRASALPEEYPSEIYKVKNGDTFLFALISKKGAFGYLNFISGAYRIHEGGIWSMVDELKQERAQINTCKTMLSFFKSKDEQQSIYHRICNSLIKILKIQLNKRNYIKGIYYYFKILFYSPGFWFKRSFNYFMKSWISQKLNIKG